jgi:hypothetical protein
MFGYGAAHNGRVYRGVSILGKDLSGMNRSEAQAALTQASVGYPPESLTLSDASHKWTFSPADLGVAVDVDRTLDIAMQVGRGGSILDNAGKQMGVLFGGARITPVLKHDGVKIDGAIARVAAEIDRPAVDSKLEQGPDGKVRITPSSQGTTVDRDALRARIITAVSSVPFGSASIEMRADSPKVTEAALKASESQALLLTEVPVTLRRVSASGIGLTS